MKRTLLLVALLLSATNFYAQDKGYISASIGSCVSTGDFASTKNKPESGYALNGLTLDLSAGYKLNKYLGFSALIRRQMNQVDVQALAANMRKEVPDANSIHVNADNWVMGGYMFGGYTSFATKSEKICFDSRIMIGFLTSTSPDKQFNVSGDGYNVWVRQKSAFASAFAYLFGAGLRYNPAKHFCLTLNMDFLGANPEFTTVTTTSLGDTSKDTWSQSYGTVNYTFGIGYRFYAKNK